MRSQSAYCLVEPLEARSLCSAAPLSPSAVEGAFKGDLAYGTTVRELKLSVSPTAATLTVGSIGSKTIALSDLDFHRLRDGNFTYTGKINGETLTLTGDLESNNDTTTLTGTFTGSGRIAIEGTFDLKKQ
jgi:hypothetical protein